jgi:hypothetical protein
MTEECMLVSISIRLLSLDSELTPFSQSVLDMHGVPGSQNGEQSSGQLTKNAAFFGGDANTETSSQLRADEMIKAVIQFVETSPYRSVITGIEVSLMNSSPT